MISYRTLKSPSLFSSLSSFRSLFSSSSFPSTFPSTPFSSFSSQSPFSSSALSSSSFSFSRYPLFSPSFLSFPSHPPSRSFCLSDTMSSPSPSTANSPSSTFTRLPSNVIPIHYHLSLTPQLEEFTFDGTVVITVNVLSPTSSILLNGSELTILSSSVGSHSALSVEIDEKSETIKFTLPAGSTLPIGHHHLHIKYKGILNDKNSGFYRCQYKNKEGKMRTSATTQFEATDARKAFPSFDEPALKATFTVDINAPSFMTVLSNMPIEKEEKSADVNGVAHSVRHFHKSPIMSTYLLAFVIGEYDYIEEKTTDGLVVRVYTPLGKSEKGRFALDVAVRVMPFYNKWFDTPYPLPKLDMIAVDQLNAGAMENWGLVTYRETALLVDENSSAENKQWVAIVVNHELSHQWFGNIVTMEWWTHLWLNEGFASWTEYFACDFLFPSWGIWNQFVSDDFNAALQSDSLTNSHPIEVELNDPQEVDEAFDRISYQKGGTVVRMLQNWLGAEEFQKGISSYIKKYAYGNAKSEQLWEALEQTSGQPVQKMMTGWTKTMGYPVIEVTEEKGEEKANQKSYRLTQTRYQLNGIVTGDETLWFCPISFIYNGQSVPTSKSTLSDKSAIVNLQLPNGLSSSAIQWVKINGGATGFYRTLYPPSMWESLRQAILSHDVSLTTADRLQLQSDMFSFFYSGLVSADQFFSFMDSYKEEKELAIWSDMAKNFSQLNKILKGNDEATELLGKWVSSFCSQVLARVGYDSKTTDGHEDSLLRGKIIDLLGVTFSDPVVVKTLRDRFFSYLKIVDEKNNLDVGLDILSGDLRDSVFSSVVHNGGAFTFDLIQNLLLNVADSQEDKVRLIGALGCTKNKDLLQRALAFSLDNTKVKKQDALFLYREVSGSDRELYWNFVRDNWTAMCERYGGSFGMSRLVDMLGGFHEDQKANELVKFFQEEKHPAPAGERAVKQAIEIVRGNAKFYDREAKNIVKCLSQKVGK